MGPYDEILMNRLFGPRVPDDMESSVEDAKSVRVKSAADVPEAMDILLASIVHQGIGGGFCCGWRLYRRGGEVVLAVCRVTDAAAAA